MHLATSSIAAITVRILLLSTVSQWLLLYYCYCNLSAVAAAPVLRPSPAQRTFSQPEVARRSMKSASMSSVWRIAYLSFSRHT